MSTPSRVKLGQYVIAKVTEDPWIIANNKYVVMIAGSESLAVINEQGNEWWLDNGSYIITDQFVELPKIGDDIVMRAHVSYTEIGHVYRVTDLRDGEWQIEDDRGRQRWVNLEKFILNAPKDNKNFGRPRGMTDFRKKREDYRRIFERAGFQRIGSGHFSIVYAKPDSSEVFKCGKLGDGWLAYAKLVMTKHRDNPFAPKIKYIKWYGEGDQRWWIAKMERLQPFHYDEGQKEFSLSSSLLNGDYGNSPNAREAYVKARRKHPLLLALIEDIREDVLSKYDLDYHSENAMMLGTTLVITDPAAYPKDKELRKRFSR